jgi:hypothetical protein
MTDHSIPREWTAAVVAILQRIGCKVAEDVAAIAETVRTPYGFAQSGNGVDEHGHAEKTTWTATGIDPKGEAFPIVGVSPVMATDAFSVMVALVHGLLLESVRRFAKVTKDKNGKLKATLYGEAFTAACDGILDSPRKDKKDGSRGKFQGSQAFLPSEALSEAIKDALPSLPPLPYHVKVERTPRTTVTLRVVGPSGGKYGANAKLFDASVPATVLACLSLLSQFEKDGMIPDKENEDTLAWYASVQKHIAAPIEKVEPGEAEQAA